MTQAVRFNARAVGNSPIDYTFGNVVHLDWGRTKHSTLVATDTSTVSPDVFPLYRLTDTMTNPSATVVAEIWSVSGGTETKITASTAGSGDAAKLRFGWFVAGLKGNNAIADNHKTNYTNWNFAGIKDGRDSTKLASGYVSNTSTVGFTALELIRGLHIEPAIVNDADERNSSGLVICLVAGNTNSDGTALATTFNIALTAQPLYGRNS